MTSEGTNPRPAIVIRPEDRDPVEYGEAGGDIYAIVLPDGGPPAHIHTREEEAFFVIRGERIAGAHP